MLLMLAIVGGCSQDNIIHKCTKFHKIVLMSTFKLNKKNNDFSILKKIENPLLNHLNV